MSNEDIRKKANELSKRACEEDHKANFEEAYDLYKRSIRYFLHLYKYEQNPILKDSFQEKLGVYITRAEQLSDYLHGEENKQPDLSDHIEGDIRHKAIEIATRACEEDRKANYEDAYDLYKQAIRFFMYLYINEQNPILKTRFQEKLDEYMKRAMEITEYLQEENITGQLKMEDKSDNQKGNNLS